MKGKHLILAAAALLSIEAANGDNHYVEDFNRAVAAQGESERAYEQLYAGFSEYMVKVNNTASYSEQQQAVAALAEMFPLMKSGAYYFSTQNNQKKATKFAEAYIDISVCEAMAGANLQIDPDYPTYAYFAASNNYSARNYQKAIKYLDAYIRSGATEKAADAITFAAKSYIHLNQPQNAKQILETGLALYPNDLRMLTTMINLLGETKMDDAALQKYVTQAMRYKPNDEGLNNIQAQLYERNQMFEQAIGSYQRLKAIKPNSLEVARHLAINLYNSGVQSLKAGNKSAGEKRLREAATALNEVFVNDPLAINYAYALANCYSILGDSRNLALVNEKIVALGQEPVAGTSASSAEFMAVNNDRVSPSLAISNQPSLIVQNQQPAAQASPAASQAQHTPAPKTTSRKISDVDQNIPVSDRKYESAFAVVIANGDYQKVAKVDNAENDGKIFAEYCGKTLGIPQSHIREYYNATYGDLLDAVEDIKQIAKAKKGNLDIIFYYAGHGLPNEETKTAYLLPVDADGKQMRVCYPLSELYAELERMGANNTYVFLDACFSGATRSENSEMLMSARSVAIDVDEGEIDGKLLIFSAATGSQTALSYNEKNHGMFTYFLLKKLQESKGNIDLGTLASYIEENVSIESQLNNKKLQTPTVIVGNGYEGIEWGKLRLANNR